VEKEAGERKTGGLIFFFPDGGAAEVLPGKLGGTPARQREKKRNPHKGG